MHEPPTGGSFIAEYLRGRFDAYDISVKDEVSRYSKFFNEERPAYSLNYLTPKQFKEQYMQV